MSLPRANRSSGFTLAELIIGMGLSLMIMGALLSSYVFLARSFTRTLGVSSAAQPAMESQGRMTLTLFAKDVTAAIGITNPTASSVTLRLPTATGSTTVAYNYDATAQTLTRTPAGGPATTLHINIINPPTGSPLYPGLKFEYFDSYGRPYTSYVNYLTGIDQISLALTAQAGSAANGTQTQLYRVASPRLIMRNKQMLP